MNNRPFQPKGVIQLSPQFVEGVVGLVSEPAIICDIILNLFYPELKQKAVQRFQLIGSASPKDLYEFLHEHFPDSDSFNDTVPMHFAFRELLKHMIATAFNTRYAQPPNPYLESTQQPAGDLNDE